MNRRSRFTVQVVAAVASLSVGLIAAQAAKTGAGRGRTAGRPAADATVQDSLQSDESVARRVKPDAMPDCPDNTRTADLVYEFEGLDLDSGRIHDLTSDTRALDPDVDLSLIYDPDSRPHLRIMPEQSASAGVFVRSFDEVNCEDVSGISFGPDSSETPVSLDDTIVVFTPEGGYFKVGNFVEIGHGVVQFDYVQLCVACEPEAVDITTDPDAGETTGRN